MKKIIHNYEASINPVISFLAILAIASFLILLLGFIMEPFFNLMGFEDTDIKDSISAPRQYVFQFGQLIWAKGILIIVFFAAIFGLLMEFQKRKYQEG